jgi:Ca2+-binding RTX toxin-like protein
MKINNKHRRRAAIETLEGRRMFSAALTGNVLTITGTHVSTVDTINVQESGGNIVVSEGTSGETLQPTGFFPAAGVSSIRINTGVGRDIVTLTTSKPTTVTLGSGDDQVWAGGSTASNVFVGDSGNDIIVAGSGADHIYGDEGAFEGTGNDVICAGRGNDAVWGGAGNDEIYGEDGDDFIMGLSGNDRIYGDNGHDRIDGGYGVDVIFGGAGNDYMSERTPDTARNYLYGESGDDTFDVRNGVSDYVDGGVGYDTVYADRVLGMYWPWKEGLISIESKNA